jgi:hypothetical protein
VRLFSQVDLLAPYLVDFAVKQLDALQAEVISELLKTKFFYFSSSWPKSVKMISVKGYWTVQLSFREGWRRSKNSSKNAETKCSEGVKL